MEKLGMCLWVLIVLFHCEITIAQELNYGQMNIQGQVLSAGYEEANFEFLILKTDGDTIWHEALENIPLNEQGAFTLALGSGVWINGEASNFYELNWLEADEVMLYNTTEINYLLGAFNINAVPYSLHSLYVLEAPSIEELTDTPDEVAEIGSTLQFDGVGFINGFDETGDTAIFAWNADTVVFSDTVWFAFNHKYSDTAFFSYFADTATTAFNIVSTIYADTATYVDSAGYGLTSVGNWRIDGNSELSDTVFIGSTIDDSLMIGTNNNTKLVFGADFSTHNNFPGPGFRVRSNRGGLITPNTTAGPGSIEGAFLYYDGENYSVHGGTSLGDFDTLKGAYSFAWGENVGTNGTYSTVFGKNTYGDTAIFGGGTPYAAISSFAAGRNCHVTHMGFAVGDSAIAGYYRNIAIGEKVIATSSSAGLAMGSNVLVTGATAWAAGQNLTANGHFSTALGSNASTNGRVGSFVYGDHSTTDTVENTANHQFMVRAAGGYVFYSSADLTMGVELLPGAGSWSIISDRNKKENIVLVQPENFQWTYDSLSVTSWNYIGNTTLHIGPMAQDVYALFGVGERPTLINMVDSDGIGLLGIKMIQKRIEKLSLTEQREGLEEQINTEKEALEDMERRINKLYEELDHN